ncbi:hypothetical protein PFISCL1PPCAC_12130, partial [Pristionchus fissidentatus]
DLHVARRFTRSFNARLDASIIRMCSSGGRSNREVSGRTCLGVSIFSLITSRTAQLSIASSISLRTTAFCVDPEEILSTLFDSLVFIFFLDGAII